MMEWIDQRRCARCDDEIPEAHACWINAVQEKIMCMACGNKQNVEAKLKVPILDARERVWEWAKERIAHVSPTHFERVGTHCLCTPCHIWRAISDVKQEPSPRRSTGGFACAPKG